MVHVDPELDALLGAMGIDNVVPGSLLSPEASDSLLRSWRIALDSARAEHMPEATGAWVAAQLRKIADGVPRRSPENRPLVIS